MHHLIGDLLHTVAQQNVYTIYKYCEHYSFHMNI